MNLFLIALGGAIGSVSRFVLSSFISKYTTENFPYSTLSVNIIGAFLIGLFIELASVKYSHLPYLRYLLVTGFLGGFTTFSAFSLESALMWIRGDYFALAGYIFFSVVGTIVAVLGAIQFVKIFI